MVRSPRHRSGLWFSVLVLENTYMRIADMGSQPGVKRFSQVRGAASEILHHIPPTPQI